MAPANIDFDSRAFDELQDAYQWYAKRSPAIARAFLEEVDRALLLIAETPDRWATHYHDTRRFLLRKYAYAVVYRHSGNHVRVFAVSHAARHPGYWHDRLN